MLRKLLAPATHRSNCVLGVATYQYRDVERIARFRCVVKKKFQKKFSFSAKKNLDKNKKHFFYAPTPQAIQDFLDGQPSKGGAHRQTQTPSKSRANPPALPPDRKAYIAHVQGSPTMTDTVAAKNHLFHGLSKAICAMSVRVAIPYFREGACHLPAPLALRACCHT